MAARASRWASAAWWAVVALGPACDTAAARFAGTSPDASGEGGLPGGPRTTPECPAPSELARCAPEPGAQCGLAQTCGLDALPTACAGQAPCAIAIDPCPDHTKYAGSERVDTYVCTCRGGRWSCVDCFQGTSLCVESPDGGPYFGSSEAGPDAEPDSGEDAPADADASPSPD